MFPCLLPRVQDGVTGELLTVSIETQAASEAIQIRAAPGQSATGEVFTVTIRAIGDAFGT